MVYQINFKNLLEMIEAVVLSKLENVLWSPPQAIHLTKPDAF